MFKKFLSIFISFIFLFQFTTICFAQASSAEANATVYIVNEEEQINSLKAMTDEELLSEGFSAENIQEIRDFDYFEALSERAQLPDETLILYGYTSNEIEELRQYIACGGKARKTISSSTLTLTLRPIRNTAGKSVTFRVTWEWSHRPIIQFIDTVGVAWTTSNGSGSYYFKSENTNDLLHLTYTKVDSSAVGPETVNETMSWNNEGVTATSISQKFGIGTSVGYFMFSGYADFTIECTLGYVEEFYIDCAYGHSVVSISPSLTVNRSGPDLTVGFKGAVDEKHCKRLYNGQTFAVIHNYDT